MRYYLIPARMAITKQCKGKFDEEVEKIGPFHVDVVIKENNEEVPQKIKKGPTICCNTSASGYRYKRK